jgi:hypothetical protein
MYARKRKVHNLSGSKAVFLPPGTPTGDEASMVMDRLIWVDPEGRIPPEALLQVVRKFERRMLADIEAQEAKADGDG